MKSYEKEFCFTNELLLLKNKVLGALTKLFKATEDGGSFRMTENVLNFYFAAGQ